MYQKKYHIHFVGIGGIGMSGIAEILLCLGYRVSGSDIESSEITRRLKRLGAVVYEGHSETQIDGADVLVASAAISTENPEVAAAERATIPVIPRAEMLAELMRSKYSIAIAGAHGKTSTTSMIANVLDRGGFDPTIVIGGNMKSTTTNARLGKGDFIVVEADESDGSFLKMAPTIAVVTNIDREHLDYYQDLNSIRSSFLGFLRRIPFYGLAVLCLDNESVRDIIPKLETRFTTYGINTDADLQAKKIFCRGPKTGFSAYHLGKRLGDVLLNLPGIHNVYNSMASMAVGLELDIPFEIIKDALETLEGVQRRLEIKGEKKGVIVLDDYGHHPTEIKSTLRAMKGSWPDRRIVVVFQPHRYSRTQALFNDFTGAFNQSDLLAVLPVYPAGEKKIEGIDGQSLYESIKLHGHGNVTYAEGHRAVVAYLIKILKHNDILLTLGAGDVWKVGEMVLAELGK